VSDARETGPYRTQVDAASAVMPAAVRHLALTEGTDRETQDRATRMTLFAARDACTRAGVWLGDYDQEVLQWLADRGQPEVMQVVIGLVNRAAVNRAPVGVDPVHAGCYGDPSHFYGFARRSPDHDAPPSDRRWFRCRYCRGLFTGGPTNSQPADVSDAAQTAHEGRCTARPDDVDQDAPRTLLGELARQQGNPTGTRGESSWAAVDPDPDRPTNDTVDVEPFPCERDY
jgi:hypothetical protein